MRRNLIVVSLGRKGSGKSQLLWDLYTSRAPRVLSLDSMHESRERDPATVEVVGWSQLMAAIEKASAFKKWHIAASIEPDDLRELCTMLAPPLGNPRPSLSAAVGGMALECGEAYEVMPNGRTPDEISSMLRRARHFQLNLFMASQRPASCSRELTGLADHIYLFAQREALDIDYIERNVSVAAASMVRSLRREEFQCVRFDVDDGTIRLLDKDRRPLGRPLDTMEPAAVGRK